MKNYIELRTTTNPLQTPSVVWNISSDVNMDIKVPSMIIQIPLENAIKYAFDSVQNNNLITIDICIKNNSLSIVIDDNGKGFDPTTFSNKETGTGQGLKILFKTIGLLNAKNKETLKFDIQNKKNLSSGLSGTKVMIEIPVDYCYEI